MAIYSVYYPVWKAYICPVVNGGGGGGRGTPVVEGAGGADEWFEP